MNIHMKKNFNEFLDENFEDEFENSKQEFGEYIGKVDDEVLYDIVHDFTYLLLLQKYTLTKYK